MSSNTTKRGKLISFEGIDGCGKTTAIEAVAAYLTSKKIKFVINEQPGGTKIGTEIRNILKFSQEPLANMAELLLFCASFAQSLQEKIIPELDAGNWVILDRYTDSTKAYQGAGRNFTLGFISKLLKHTVEATQKNVPELTILLDIDPEVAKSRISKSSRTEKEDRIEAEGIEFQRKVRSAYLRLAENNPNRFRVIHVNELSPKQVSTAAIKLIEGLVENPVEEDRKSDYKPRDAN